MRIGIFLDFSRPNEGNEVEICPSNRTISARRITGRISSMRMSVLSICDYYLSDELASVFCCFRGVGRSIVQVLVEPSLGELPIVVHRSKRDIQVLSNFFTREPTEES